MAAADAVRSAADDGRAPSFAASARYRPAFSLSAALGAK